MNIALVRTGSPLSNNFFLEWPYTHLEHLYHIKCVWLHSLSSESPSLWQTLIFGWWRAWECKWTRFLCRKRKNKAKRTLLKTTMCTHNECLIIPTTWDVLFLYRHLDSFCKHNHTSLLYHCTTMSLYHETIISCPTLCFIACFDLISFRFDDLLIWGIHSQPRTHYW